MKKNGLYTAGILTLSAVVPLVCAAAFTQTAQLITGSMLIVRALTFIVSGVALLVFFWGIVKYIASAGDAEKAREGKSIMIYGVIALFVLFSVFGLITFLRQELMIGPENTLTPPTVH